MPHASPCRKYRPHASCSGVGMGRKVIEKASRVVMLMDHSKMGRSLPFTFATLADIDVLVTDAKPPEELIQEAEKQGVQIVVANAE